MRSLSVSDLVKLTAVLAVTGILPIAARAGDSVPG